MSTLSHPAPVPPACRLLVSDRPDGGGKTKVGVELALRLNAEIVSLDSMTLYQGMDIGTAKPSAEDRAACRITCSTWCRRPRNSASASTSTRPMRRFAEIKSRGREVLFVGGTPLYLKSLLRGVYQGPPADWEFRAADRRAS